MPKILLLGTGNIANHHVAEFASIPECRIVGCVDRIPGRAKAFAANDGGWTLQMKNLEKYTSHAQ